MHCCLQQQELLNTLGMFFLPACMSFIAFYILFHLQEAWQSITDVLS